VKQQVREKAAEWKMAGEQEHDKIETGSLYARMETYN
jgi:hypothetical protein